MRTFIAIVLSQEIKAFLSNIEEELKQARADVKWVEPDNIHLTLKFLGEIKEDRALEVQSVLAEVAQSNSPFSLYLSAIGAFPKLEYPRTIWIGVTSEQPVLKIAEALEKGMLKIGMPAESRSFSAHITLGRVRSALNRKSLIEKIESFNKGLPACGPELKVSTLTLFKSTLTPHGPVYETLLSSPLIKA
ncbi:RNA 2',3'-cyclic phosphodiesterase [Candidatus Omnitrophota bacterium]